MTLKGIDFTGIAIIGGVLIVGYAAYKTYKFGSSVASSISDGATAAKDAVVSAAPYVNPVDERNVINQGFNGALGWITGDPNFSLGSKIYDLTHSQGSAPGANSDPYSMW